ncbi:hypothetical protein P175DRAFT_0555271 [Aspergillus ochraceoroseus IBT 24754]|uniref:Uncharacterized protein n=1 Tax=Aspergillus ochraceoroseus IBT 24754 TaxID=1392256 RepID=A0A2T5M253_9EURO|nr:uncharacterized protein P175DRAFT_0555271 [Aspergillus ochraceoroseus IBT 24754]PTU22607.1 hypothetical protein P175DRAFT_0555271 [Aspergillus ochraceoroseus IBT 24754]
MSWDYPTLGLDYHCRTMTPAGFEPQPSTHQVPASNPPAPMPAVVPATPAAASSLGVPAAAASSSGGTVSPVSSAAAVTPSIMVTPAVSPAATSAPVTPAAPAVVVAPAPVIPAAPAVILAPVAPVAPAERLLRSINCNVFRLLNVQRVGGGMVELEDDDEEIWVLGLGWIPLDLVALPDLNHAYLLTVLSLA